MVRAAALLASSAVAAARVCGRGSTFLAGADASPDAGGGGAIFFSIPWRPAARQVAIATYGLMSAAVWRYSTRVALAPGPLITRIAEVRFSIPQVAVSGAQTPGT